MSSSGGFHLAAFFDMFCWVLLIAAALFFGTPLARREGGGGGGSMMLLKHMLSLMQAVVPITSSCTSRLHDSDVLGQDRAEHASCLPQGHLETSRRLPESHRITKSAMH